MLSFLLALGAAYFEIIYPLTITFNYAKHSPKEHTSYVLSYWILYCIVKLIGSTFCLSYFTVYNIAFMLFSIWMIHPDYKGCLLLLSMLMPFLTLAIGQINDSVLLELFRSKFTIIDSKECDKAEENVDN